MTEYYLQCGGVDAQGRKKFCTPWSGECRIRNGQVEYAHWERDCRNCKVAGGVPYDCSSPFRETSDECDP